MLDASTEHASLETSVDVAERRNSVNKGRQRRAAGRFVTRKRVCLSFNSGVQKAALEQRRAQAAPWCRCAAAFLWSFSVEVRALAAAPSAEAAREAVATSALLRALQDGQIHKLIESASRALAANLVRCCATFKAACD